MAGPDWTVQHRDHGGVLLGTYRPINLSFSLRRNEPGDITYELALGDPSLRRDAFAPWRTEWYLRRGGNLIEGGIHTGRNLQEERDSVLISGKSWLEYLDHRIYPFTPEDYIKDNWRLWPKQWPSMGNPAVDVRIIVEEIIQAMVDDDPDYTPPFIIANKNTGTKTVYKIFPGDSTKVLQHIRTLSEQTEGFDYDVIPASLEFRMWGPPDRRDSGLPVYNFKITGTESAGPINGLDWTDEGPVATNTVGLGVGGPKGLKMGRSKTYIPSKRRYLRTDVVVDVGRVRDQDMLDRVVDARNDRHPQKVAGLQIANPEFLVPNFYTGGRPRSLIGNRIRITRDYGYHKVDAYFIVNALNFTVDNAGNELVTPDVEMIYIDAEV